MVDRFFNVKGFLKGGKNKKVILPHLMQKFLRENVVIYKNI